MRADGETAPIKVLIYNGSGSDIQLFELDAEGKRSACGTIGEESVVPVTTYVDSPWVDRGSRRGNVWRSCCRDSKRAFTRGRAGERPSPGGGVLPRTVPLAGSEATLREYIEAVGRGEPDYDRMTSEVAAQTRQQLPFNQAILSRLGALRAMSFRGVSVSAATSISSSSPTVRRSGASAWSRTVRSDELRWVRSRGRQGEKKGR